MKKLISVLLAVCMVFSMITVSAVSAGAATVGKGAATGASGKTIYVGVIDYLNLTESNYMVHYWGGTDGAKDATLTATGKTVQQAVGSSYWSNEPQPFKMYTATIPADATGFKVHNGNTWFGGDGDPNKNNTAYVFEWGGNYNAYYTNTEEPASEPSTEAPTTEQPDTTPILGEGAYYIVGTMNNWQLDEAYKLTKNDAAEVDEYMFTGLELAKDSEFKVLYYNASILEGGTVWFPAGGDDYNYGHNGEITADGTYDVYFRPNGDGGEDWFQNLIYVASVAPATTEAATTEAATTEEPTTEASTTEEPGTTPIVGAGAYYIVGTMNNWQLDEAYKLTKNDAAEAEEYMFTGLELAKDSEFKVLYYNASILEGGTVWFPAGGDDYNYGHNGEITADGTYDVYFRPNGDGGEDWFHNLIYVAGEAPATTEESTTEAATTEESTTEATTTDVPATEVTEIELTGDYYLVGYIDGADYYGKDNKFADGKVTITTSATSYFIVTDGTNYFMTTGWQGEVTEATLYNADLLGADADKLMAPAGELTFTLKAYSDGTYKLSYTAEAAPTTTEASTTEEPGTTPIVGAGAYYIVGTMNNWQLDEAYKLTKNDAAEVEEYMFTGLELAKDSEFKVLYYNASILEGGTVWFPAGGDEFNYGHNGEITADGTYDVYFRPNGDGGEDWFHNVIYVAGEEPATAESTTEAATTEESTTEASTTEEPGTTPIVGAGAYYIVGTMNNWQLDEAYKLTKNDAAEVDEYMFTGLELAKDSEFKVLYYNASILEGGTVWFPAGGDEFNYGHNGEITADGTYDVYFRPNGDGGEDWFQNLIYVASVAPATTESATTEAATTEEPTTEATTTDVPATEVTEIELTGDYYLVGYIDGADYYGKDNKFADGKVSITTSATSYFIVTDGTNYFMTKGWQGEVTEATLYNADLLGADADKLMAPAGELIFTLKAYSDGTFKLSYTAEAAPATTEAVTTEEPGTTPIVGAGAYYIVGTMNNWQLDEAYKLTKNDAAEVDEYMFTGLELAKDSEFKVLYYNASILEGGTVWFPAGGDEFNYGHNGEITADGKYDVYFRPNADGGEDWFQNLIYVASVEPATVESTTEESTTEVPATTEEPGTTPIVGAGAYYIVGTMNNWQLDEAYKLTKNDAAEVDEYMFTGLELAKDSEFKVLYYNASILEGGTVWFPAGGDEFNYGHNGEITADGTYDVYFRPNADGGDDWFQNVIYVASVAPATTETAITEAATTEEPTTEATTTDVPATEVTEIELTGDYYLVGYIDGADYYGTDHQFADGKVSITTSATSYFIVTDGTNYFMTKGWQGEVTEATLYNADLLGADADKLMAPAGELTFTLKAYSDGTFKLSYTAEQVSTTEAVTTEEPGTTPIVGEGAYYIVGTMNNWQLDEAYKLTKNDAAEVEEYMFTGLELAKDSEFKVLYYNASIHEGGTVWFPAGGDEFNYGHNGEITADGTYDVYFRPNADGGEDWFHNLIYVASAEPATVESTTETPTTEEPATETPTTDVTEIELTGDYYLVGYIDGADYYGTDHQFAEGKVSITTSATSYFIVFDGTNYFMTKGWLGEVTEADLYNSELLGADADKLMAPAGNLTFTLKAYSDGTYTLSYTVDETPGTEPGTNPPAGDEGYYLVGNMTGWKIDASYKLAKNDGAETEEYMISDVELTTTSEFKIVYSKDGTALTSWYPDLVPNYGANGEITANGTYTVYFRPKADGDKTWYHYVIQAVADEVTTDEPGTEPTTEEPGTEPPAGEEGYYLVGNMTGWKIDASYKFTKNDGAEVEEYTLEDVDLTTTSEFKVVYSKDGTALTKWYPDLVDNYGANGEITADGTYDVYFRPNGDGGDDWFYNVIYVAGEAEPLIGDVDGNGVVNIEDATMLQRYLAEFIDLTDDQKLRADVTGDNRLSIKDVTAIQRIVAELPYK